MAGSNSLGGLTVEWVQHCRCNHSTKHHPHDITAWSTCTQQFHIIKYSIIHIHTKTYKYSNLQLVLGTHIFIWIPDILLIVIHLLIHPHIDKCTKQYTQYIHVDILNNCHPYLIIYCLLHRKHSIERRRSNKLQETVSKPF